MELRPIEAPVSRHLLPVFQVDLLVTQSAFSEFAHAAFYGGFEAFGAGAYVDFVALASGFGDLYGLVFAVVFGG